MNPSHVSMPSIRSSAASTSPALGRGQKKGQKKRDGSKKQRLQGEHDGNNNKTNEPPRNHVDANARLLAFCSAAIDEAAKQPRLTHQVSILSHEQTPFEKNITPINTNANTSSNSNHETSTETGLLHRPVTQQATTTTGFVHAHLRRRVHGVLVAQTVRLQPQPAHGVDQRTAALPRASTVLFLALARQAPAARREGVPKAKNGRLQALDLWSSERGRGEGVGENEL